MNDIELLTRLADRGPLSELEQEALYRILKRNEKLEQVKQALQAEVNFRLHTAWASKSRCVAALAALEETP